MTLNDLERRYSRYSLTNSIALQADHVTVVEDRPNQVHKILSPSFSLPLFAKTHAPCIYPSAVDP